jgi:hypothetical protein
VSPAPAVPKRPHRQRVRSESRRPTLLRPRRLRGSLTSPHVKSLLARVTPADIVREPFPHVVFHEPLDPRLCDCLIEEFPSLDAVSGGRPYRSNELLVYHASRELQDPELTPLWREMIATHLSQEFIGQLLALFSEPIRETYPSLFKRLGPPHTPRAGIRHVDTFEHTDVLLEAQAALNTPVTVQRSAVRGAHLDNPNKLVIGLYYLRHPEDDTSGGDLEFYRYTTPHPEFQGHELPRDFVETVKTVPYESNVLVLFLNTIDSLHGVTPREPTPWTRMFLNLGSQVQSDLFRIYSGEARMPEQVQEGDSTHRPSTRRRRHLSQRRVPVRPRGRARHVARQQARFLLPGLGGIGAFAVAAVAIEVAADRDWALSGLEWPAGFVTAVLLVCLVPLLIGRLRASVDKRRLRPTAS